METQLSKQLQNVSMFVCFFHLFGALFDAAIQEMIGQIANWKLGVLNLKMERMETQ